MSIDQFLPHRTIGDMFLTEIRRRMRDAAKYFGPIENFVVAMSPTTAAVLMKQRDLHSLTELRDWMGVKAILTCNELSDGTAVIWEDDGDLRVRRSFE